MKRNGRSRAFSWLIIIALLVSMLPAAVLAATDDAKRSDAQIYTTADGDTLYFADKLSAGKTNATKTISGPAGSGLEINMAKTIEGTEAENEFIITLSVDTNSLVTDTQRSDAAVTIVLDISGSMLKNQMSGSTVKPYDERRLTKAVAAINDFIEEFSVVEDAEGNTIPGERWVSVVVFGNEGNCKVLRDWVNVGNGEDLSKTNEVEAVQLSYTDEGTNGTLSAGDVTASLSASQNTCISGGLSTALSQLNSLPSTRTITCKNTILFTDGEPNVNDGKGASVPEGSYGNNDVDFQWAEYRASAVRAQSTLFTVAYGSEGHAQWLGNYIASNESYNFSGTDELDLGDVFTVIKNRINMMANAWTVTDPMGENIEFVEFLGTNTGTVRTADGFTWDLKADSSVDLSVENVSKYSLRYKVKLNTLTIDESDWNGGESAYFLTNGETVLTYTFEKVIKEAEGEEEAVTEVLDSDSENFLVPAVKGYCSSLDFVKTDAQGEKIDTNLATFTLESKAQDAEGNPLYKKTATAENGDIHFENIPSGHEYILTETVAPEVAEGEKEYVLPSKTSTVQVEDGTLAFVAGGLLEMVTVTVENEELSRLIVKNFKESDNNPGGNNPGGNNPGGNKPGGNTPKEDEVTNIEEEETPLAGGETSEAVEEAEELIIVDEEVPLADLPFTGFFANQENPAYALGLIAAAITLALFGLYLSVKRKNNA